jgi:hypothetical protein
LDVAEIQSGSTTVRMNDPAAGFRIFTRFAQSNRASLPCASGVTADLLNPPIKLINKRDLNLINPP